MTGIYNTRFIYYNDAGEILCIRPVPPNDNTLYLEIDFSLVEEFLFGNKSYSNYKINYFLNLLNGVVNEEEIFISQEQKFLYIVPITTSLNNEITIEHNGSHWNIILREDMKEKIKLFSRLDFFVCKKDDPTFLFLKFSIDLNNILPINFTTEYEKNLESISLVTSKRFKSYGIKKII